VSEIEALREWLRLRTVGELLWLWLFSGLPAESGSGRYRQRRLSRLVQEELDRR
jgi:hypothetical protein